MSYEILDRSYEYSRRRGSLFSSFGDSFMERSYMSDTTVVREDSLDLDDDDDLEDGRISGASGSSWKKFSRRQVFLFILFSITNFFAGVTFSLMAPFYPAEAERKGATATEYGMVFGIFELVAFLASPLFGKYLRVLGPRRTFIAGILITGVATTFFGVLDKTTKTTFLTLSFLIRIVAALGDAALITSNFSLVAVEFPRYVATTFATLETFFGLGLIVGPTLGGALFELGGFKLPFISVGVAFAVVGLVALVTMTIDKEGDDCNEEAPGILSLLKIPTVTLAALSILACSISMGFLSATLEPHVRQFGLTPVGTGLVFITYGGIYALTAPVWGWLCDKFVGAFKLTILGEITIFLGFVLVGPVAFLPMEPALWVTCVGLVIYGTGLGATMVSSFILALEEAVTHGCSDNVQTYGVVSALWNSFFALGAFIGPSLGGVLLDHVGFRWATVFVLITQFLVIFLFGGFVFMKRNFTKEDFKKEENNYSKNLSETAPLLKVAEDPCCSKMLTNGNGSYDASTESTISQYGTNHDLMSKTFSSSSS